VIRSFRDRETERLWRRERVRSLDSRVLRPALRKLAILDAAGQHSIRINDQWRMREATEVSKLAPIHPGEVLMEDFITPLGITQ